MGLSDAFNSGYRADKANDYVLTVKYDVAGYTTVLAYDFMARVMTLRTDGYGDGGVRLTPFAQLDRDSLVGFRDELVRQGGKPPELPPEAPQLPRASRGLTP
ncbi:MAG TPA: hypothetical protein VEF76_08425 [Patescibacteria group bacterium]|nr:hypothetical protein [Patescibacteria group bacterium]